MSPAADRDQRAHARATDAQLVVCDVGLAAGGARLLDHASLSLAPGELVVLLGPNGAGKTSLLRVALGLLRPEGGSATLNGRDTGKLRADERARELAYLPQARPLAWPIRARDVVALGRFAYSAAPGRLGAMDARAVDAALAACDLADLAERATDTLSGGELARVHVARALAAEAPLMIADEPVASLDPRHQHNVMRLIRDYVARGGGALVVLHDLDLAAHYADRLVWMVGGRTLTSGPVAETMTSATIAEVYGVAATVSHAGGAVRVWIDG